MLTNKEQGELAFLLHNGVTVEVGASGGGQFGTQWIEYAVFIPAVQREICGDLDEFDGIHYIDKGEYCGYADSLEDAYREFISNNPDIDSYISNYSESSTHEMISQYVSHIKNLEATKK